MRLLLALIMLPWLVSTAFAGAWPREKDTAFLSFSSEFVEYDIRDITRQSFGLYGEYGATDRLTIGFDLWGDALRMSKAIAFMRWPLGRTERPLKLAFVIGAGKVEDETALRPGLSLGRGFSLGERHGWLAADTRAVLFTGGGTTLETDLTAGLVLAERFLGILQLQASMPDEEQDYLRLAPSVVYEMRPGLHLEIGLIEPLAGGGERGFKLGFWRTF